MADRYQHDTLVTAHTTEETHQGVKLYKKYPVAVNKGAAEC
ncbi:MAG TPA: hypothetical protein PKD12_14360 [Nitrospira sp.]|nr:hypothetical protein [Nitrospira sp.]